ncbi:MAG TPA: lamin tail domain-containing protein [Polyangia bacterium]|nr:lamin tail domain-containing protein [Polyangia bacterium]
MARFTLALTLAAASVAGCAHPMSPLAGDDRDLANEPGAEDLAPAEAADLSRAVDAGANDLARAPADLATPPPTTACHVVINELQTGTSQTGTAEFVELYNPCASAVTLSNWKLVYRAASNTNAAGGADSSALYTWASGSIAAGGYRVYGGSGWTGASDGALASGLAVNGAVGLRDGAGALVDSVAYGSAAGGFMEGGAAPAPPTAAAPGESIERLPNGADTDDNSHDFHVAATPTPGAANH